MKSFCYFCSKRQKLLGMCMENLVRRLGRILIPKRTIPIQRPLSERTRQKMDRLEHALTVWKKKKGWRQPLRNLSDAADALGTDTTVLHYYFRDRVGLDFRTWRTRLRLEEACQLLVEEPGTAAADIGLRVGFSNRSNFSRQFLAYTGLTPARWREKARMSPDIQASEKRL